MISIWFFFQKNDHTTPGINYFKYPDYIFKRIKNLRITFLKLRIPRIWKNFFFFDFIARQSRNNLMYHHHSSIGEEFCLSEFSFRLNRWFFSIIFHFRTNIHAYTHLERLPSQVNNVFQMKEKKWEISKKMRKTFLEIISPKNRHFFHYIIIIHIVLNKHTQFGWTTKPEKKIIFENSRQSINQLYRHRGKKIPVSVLWWFGNNEEKKTKQKTKSINTDFNEKIINCFWTSCTMKI